MTLLDPDKLITVAVHQTIAKIDDPFKVGSHVMNMVPRKHCLRRCKKTEAVCYLVLGAARLGVYVVGRAL